MTDRTLPKIVRKYIYDYFLENEQAPVIEQVMKEFKLGRDEAHSVLIEIETVNHNLALVPGTQWILMAHPILSSCHTFQGSRR